MKKVLAVVLVMVTMFTTVIASAKAPELSGNFYPLTVKVIDINTDYDVITAIDGAGNIWQWDGDCDWLLGDYASLLMYDFNTPKIFDDEIVDIKYTGFRDTTNYPF